MQALDATLAGASLRDVGEGLFGADAVADWYSDGGLRSKVRRLVRRGDALMRGGYRLLLDADAEQEAVLARVIAGQSLVVHTLPGTGGTQTVINAVGALVREGRRVLVVSARRSTLDGVRHRLAVRHGRLACRPLEPESGVQRVDDGRDAEDFCDTAVVAQGKCLRQIPDDAVDGHHALGGLQFTGDESQQCTLACAVGRDESGAAGARGEGQIGEQWRVVGPREGQMAADDRWHADALVSCEQRPGAVSARACVQVIGAVNRLNISVTPR